MTAIKHIKIERNTTKIVRFNVKYRDDDGVLQPLNLSGYNAGFAVRRTDVNGQMVLHFTTTPNITIDGVGGVVIVRFNPEDTTDITYPDVEFMGRYDLDLHAPDGSITRPFSGNFVVPKNVIR